MTSSYRISQLNGPRSGYVQNCAVVGDIFLFVFSLLLVLKFDCFILASEKKRNLKYRKIFCRNSAIIIFTFCKVCEKKSRLVRLAKQKSPMRASVPTSAATALCDRAVRTRGPASDRPAEHVCRGVCGLMQRKSGAASYAESDFCLLSARGETWGK